MNQETILIVEDDQSMLKGIAAVLRAEGYVAVKAMDGKEALARLRETTPDLVLSDIMMPVMDGYEFYQEMRRNPAWEFVPFIFITAMGQPHEIRKGKLLGVDDYVTKPFEIDDLMVTVKSRLRRARGVRAASQREMRILNKRILRLLSHELRTPLSYIRGYADLAVEEGDDADPEKVMDFLRGVSVGSGRLESLVDDLLLVVAIEGGQITSEYEVRKASVEGLADIVAETAADFEPQASKVDVSLRVDAAANLPAIEGNPKFLADALGRLVDNAIKFSNPGGYVDIHANRRNSCLHISVADDGVGIPLEEQPFIFDVFHQAERRRQEQQGAGLGLTIARGLVEVHGGTLSLESREHAGSTFLMELPILKENPRKTT